MQNYNAIDEQIKALTEQICDKLLPNGDGATFTQQLFVANALRKIAHTTKMEMVKHMTTTFNV
jgi:hypothetical protein